MAKEPPMIPAGVWNAIEETWRVRSANGWEPGTDISKMYLMCGSTIVTSQIFGDNVDESFACPLNSYRNCKGSLSRCCWGLAAKWHDIKSSNDIRKAIDVSKKVHQLILKQRFRYEVFAKKAGGIYLKGLQMDQRTNAVEDSTSHSEGYNSSSGPKDVPSTSQVSS